MSKHGKRGNERLSEEEFTLQAIKRLRKGSYKGIHAVYSGFNTAFRQYFGTDPVASMERMAKAGKVVLRPAKGGVVMYHPKDAPKELTKKPKTNEVLNRILGQ